MRGARVAGEPPSAAIAIPVRGKCELADIATVQLRVTLMVGNEPKARGSKCTSCWQQWRYFACRVPSWLMTYTAVSMIRMEISVVEDRTVSQ